MVQETFTSPIFGGGIINRMTDREAMGYPTAFADTRFQHTEDIYRHLMSQLPQDLARLAEDPDGTLAERLVAGRLLALIGDCRLDPLCPPMVTIPGNQVALGLPRDKIDEVMTVYSGLGLQREWIEKETPVYDIVLNSFRIAKYPVTNREYLIFLQETDFPEIPTSWEFGCYPQARANSPVYTVTPEAAEQYAQWLSERTQRAFRLPTEAEWEYSASGPEGLEFPWGNAFLPDLANTVETGLLSSTPVGIFPGGVSPFGVSDMAGNVEEYVADDYHPYPEGRSIEDDLMVQTGHTYRIARGGSFTRFRDLARCRRRHGRYMSAIYVMGFRLAEDI